MLVANVVVTAVMMLVAAGAPQRRAVVAVSRRDRLTRQPRLRGYYSEYAASHFAASVWVNNAWVSALCLGLGILRAPVVWLLWNNVANLAVIGAVCDPARACRPLLRADPPARAAAGADGGLRLPGSQAEVVLV
ncbi:MAG: stage II sporulation protein M [Nocardioides sp.]